MKYFVLISICAAINSLDDTNEAYRKMYGLSFHRNCGNYIKTFKCLTACKSMGFKVFRLDYACKCTCHELKTTTVLPAFVWRTNGTTKKPPQTFSPKLYAVVGTLSPAPTETNEDTTTSDDNKCTTPSKSDNSTAVTASTPDKTDKTTNTADTDGTSPANITTQTTDSNSTTTG